MKEYQIIFGKIRKDKKSYSMGERLLLDENDEDVKSLVRQKNIAEVKNINSNQKEENRESSESISLYNDSIEKLDELTAEEMMKISKLSLAVKKELLAKDIEYIKEFLEKINLNENNDDENRDEYDLYAESLNEEQKEELRNFDSKELEIFNKYSDEEKNNFFKLDEAERITFFQENSAKRKKMLKEVK